MWVGGSNVLSDHSSSVDLVSASAPVYRRVFTLADVDVGGRMFSFLIPDLVTTSWLS